MSYQQTQSLRTFIPSYEVRSDYLPTRVTEGNNPQASDLVTIFLILSFVDMRKKNAEEEFSLKDQPSLTQIDMCPL